MSDPIRAALERLIAVGNRSYCALSEFIILLNSQKSCMVPEYETQRCELLDAIAAGKAALAKSDGPAVPESREPASVVVESIDDAELDELFTEIDQSGEPLSWRAYARAVLARWGHQPTPPAEGEVAELVAALQADANLWGELGECVESTKCRRAAELLQQQQAEIKRLRAELQECRQVFAAFENFNQQRNAND